MLVCCWWGFSLLFQNSPRVSSCPVSMAICPQKVILRHSTLPIQLTRASFTIVSQFHMHFDYCAIIASNTAPTLYPSLAPFSPSKSSSARDKHIPSQNAPHLGNWKEQAARAQHESVKHPLSLYQFSYTDAETPHFTRRQDNIMHKYGVVCGDCMRCMHLAAFSACD